MTDRVNGCWVAFDKEYRVDDAESILNAIRMTKGVASVDINECISDPESWILREQICRDVSSTTSFVLHAMITGRTSYCPDKAKVIESLQKIIHRLQENK